MPLISELLDRQQLLKNTSDSAALDTEILLAHCLEKNRAYLRSWPEKAVSRQQAAAFETLIAKRERGEPVAYLTGLRGFWSLELAVSPATLIPRPETELLIETVLEIFSERPPATILDLGTGTGAIALALATEYPESRILACDIEPQAVLLAQSNRDRLGLDNVRVFQSDWFAQLPAQRFDCIVSNPPYIDPQDAHLQQGDVRFEPMLALVAENNGLAAIEEIVAMAPGYLNPQGWLLFEHGYEQGPAAAKIMQRKGFERIEIRKDLAGLDRVTAGQLHE